MTAQQDRASRVARKIALIVLMIAYPSLVWAHGGIPLVLEINPPLSEGGPLWVVDTLGLFLGDQLSDQAGNRATWSWLCDDAIDPTLGVDVIEILHGDTLLAVARSGLYRSEDRGCSFQRITGELLDHSIGDLSSHPTRHAEIALYTDTLGRTNGVWLSQDRGVTWRSAPIEIEGHISSLIRHPTQPEQLWLSHNFGISVSIDGGESFENINVDGYGIDASPTEGKLLAVHDLGGLTHLWVSLNQYPISTLVLSTDKGRSWRAIHTVNDSYDQVVMTSNQLWVSTPFEGLFTYTLSSAEATQTQDAWNGLWRQRRDVFVSCLVADPLEQDTVWSCGRSNPTDWVAARSSDGGESWEVFMTDYAEAANRHWDCPAESPSIIACASRCLDANCDPSGQIPPIDPMSGGAPQEEREQTVRSDRGCSAYSQARIERSLFWIFGIALLISNALISLNSPRRNE